MRKTQRFGSRPWSKDTLNGMLRSPFYAGRVKHGDQVYEGEHEGIISCELWDRTKAIRDRRTKRGRTHWTKARVYLLSGLVRCDACGEPLRRQSRPGGHRYYRDTSRERSLDCRSKATSVSCDGIDQEIGKIVCGFNLPDTWQEWVLNRLKQSENHRNVEAERKSIEDQLRRLARAYIDAGMTDAEYEREKRRLQEKLAYLENPEIKTVLDAGQVLKTLSLAWEKATAQERRDILRLIFDAVYLDLEKAVITGLVPKSPFRVFFDGVDKEKDLAQLCKVGEERFLLGCLS